MRIISSAFPSAIYITFLVASSGQSRCARICVLETVGARLVGTSAKRVGLEDCLVRILQGSANAGIFTYTAGYIIYAYKLCNLEIFGI